MKKTGRLSAILIIDVILFAAVFLAPSHPQAPIREILLAVFAAAAFFLLFLLGRSKSRKPHVSVRSIEPVSRINPAQYLTRNGVVSPGGDGRYHVVFLLQDGSRLGLSLSARQAGPLAVGMRGTLIHRDAVFLSFQPDT